MFTTTGHYLRAGQSVCAISVQLHCTTRLFLRTLALDVNSQNKKKKNVKTRQSREVHFHALKAGDYDGKLAQIPTAFSLESYYNAMKDKVRE